MGGEIVCAHVRKTYRTGKTDFEAVRSVNFSVERGEFVSILGPSGCGKSTLLMMLGGLEPVTDGRIMTGGKPMIEPSTDIGIIFQDANLLPWKTALDNILFPIDMMRRPRARYRARALELLRVMGLADAASKKPGQLSGGMRQRIALCRALISDPSILLMDEPFSALDAITRDEMNVVLLDLWERYHKTAIFVTHSIREAVLLSDRVLVMGGRPSSIVAEVRVPFPRPRSFEVGDSKEFNELCHLLRDAITPGRGAPAATVH